LIIENASTVKDLSSQLTANELQSWQDAFPKELQSFQSLYGQREENETQKSN
jgi:hypothetical protein